MQFSTSPAPMAQQLRISCRPTRLPCHRRVTAPVEPRRAEPPVLPAGLRAESLPRHVALNMDGNSRWALARGLSTDDGHEAMKHAFQEVVCLSRAWGIRVLTAYCFSHENWGRPKEEVDFLLDVFDRWIHENVAEFVSVLLVNQDGYHISHPSLLGIPKLDRSSPEDQCGSPLVSQYPRQGTRLRAIGDCSRLPVSLQNTIKEAEQATSSNSQFDVILAISYSGRWDIVQACANLAQKVHDKLLSPDEIDESLFAKELQGSCANEFPYPDLVIRTSGELRLSNFHLWESAYSELFFTKTLWPDFGEADYLEALISFQGRDRRFGKRT